jgi:phage tail P2-like protein
MPASRKSLLPPNAKTLERALEATAARIEDVPVPVDRLWNPDTCPVPLLPWLAWAWSIDRWKARWSIAEKRAAVKTALELQWMKGTPASVEAVLASFDELLRVVEWFETTPRGAPHTFEIVLPLGAAGGDRATAAFAEEIVRDVTRFKPAHVHFTLVQSLRCAGDLRVAGAAHAVGFSRIDAAAAHDPSPTWATYLQTEDGEPFETEDGQFLEEDA